MDAIGEADQNALQILASPTSLTPVQIEVLAVSPLLNPGSLSLAVTSKSNTPNVEQKLELFNFMTQSFESVNESPVGIGCDTVELSFAENVDKFINPANCQVRCRISYSTTGPALFFPWTIAVEQVQFEVSQ